MTYINFKEVSKKYQVSGEVTVNAVNQVNFTINEGEFVVIVGASGAGKTTLLNLLGGMEKTSSGTIVIDNKEISSLKKEELTEYRRNDVGFVFQFYNLVPNLSALENIELAAEVCKEPLNSREVLSSVGLDQRAGNFPSQLSGGEQQRVSIARALAKNPKMLLCDEPTGALDSETGKTIIKLLIDTSKKMNKTVIIVTHNAEFTKIADKVIKMHNGKIADIYRQESPSDVEDLVW